MKGGGYGEQSNIRGQGDQRLITQSNDRDTGQLSKEYCLQVSFVSKKQVFVIVIKRLVAFVFIFCSGMEGTTICKIFQIVQRM